MGAEVKIASTPLPIISSGTLLETDEGVSSRVAMLAKTKVPQETFSDTMSIGDKRFSALWRPNNFRRSSRFKFKQKDVSYPVSNQYQRAERSAKNVWTIRDYDRITLMLGPNVITAIWSQRIICGEKEHFVLESDDPNEPRAMANRKVEEIRILLDNVLADAAERLGALIDEPIWGRFENYLEESGVDKLVAKLPRGCVVYESFYKKVYDKGIEFMPSSPGEDPAMRLSTYLKNRAFEDVAPEVAAEMAALRRDVAQKFLLLMRSIEHLEKAPAGSLRAAAKPGQMKLGRFDK